jgi:hypothetical protein
MKLLVRLLLGTVIAVALCGIVAVAINGRSSSSAVAPTAAPAADTTTDKPAENPAPADTDSAEIPADTDIPAPTEAPVLALGSSRANPAPIQTEYVGTMWKFAVLEIISGEAAAKLIAETNQFNKAAPAGFTYHVVKYRATNVSTDANKANSAMFALDTHITGDGLRTYGNRSVVLPLEFKSELFPNGSEEGQVAYVVPTDETNKILVIKQNFADNPLYIALDADARVVTAPSTSANSDAGTDRSQPAAMGSTIDAGNISFTINEVIRGADAATRITEANQFNDPAPAGQEFFLARVSITNHGNGKPDALFNAMFTRFNLMGNQQVIHDTPSTVAPAPSLGILSESIYAGGTLEGWVVMMAPADEQGLMIVYQPMMDINDLGNRYIAVP